MRTVSDLTQDIIKQSPYLEEALRLGIVNYTGLARKIKPQIEAKSLKRTSLAAIVMAIQRLAIKLKKKNVGKLKIILPQDLSVRSNLAELVYKVSPRFGRLQEELLRQLTKDSDIFFSASQGVFEATIIVSQSVAEQAEKIFKQEKLLQRVNGLSALILRFSVDTIKQAGVYYYILKALAWENITIAEVISVGSELSLIFEDSQIQKAFAVIQSIIKQK